MADNILSTIKRIVQETVRAMVLSDNIIGTVVSTDPLRVRISDKITLEKTHFYILKNAIGVFPVSTTQGNGNCTHSLKIGSKVILNRCLGGEKYVILGELVG